MFQLLSAAAGLWRPHEPEQQDTDQQEDDGRINAQDGNAADPEREIGMVDGKYSDILSGIS